MSSAAPLSISTVASLSKKTNPNTSTSSPSSTGFTTLLRHQRITQCQTTVDIFILMKATQQRLDYFLDELICLNSKLLSCNVRFSVCLSNFKSGSHSPSVRVMFLISRFLLASLSDLNFQFYMLSVIADCGCTGSDSG
ncbi:hypothetical protein L2E82_09164 [Cichorium intybus]|uniref:Uncharacterized protein n=1 Tax=Cichorium intybus TaxID=13427 RepID=A0ACB9G7Q1_CICIN|nr:hypothetical protein L2E82_09164 [Cichorium intybus]